MARIIVTPIAMDAYQVFVAKGLRTSAPGFTVPGSLKKNRALEFQISILAIILGITPGEVVIDEYGQNGFTVSLNINRKNLFSDFLEICKFYFDICNI